MSLTDLKAREQALSVTVSAIIEAGAGAGKTSLMVQRYFALLATVDAPEQVLFCTFTRAATQEMLFRVTDALTTAKNKPRPEADYERLTYDLARKVVERDEAMNWGLLQNISRMNILTLDGLAAKIAKQMPILSGMGGDINVSADAFPMYLKAGMSVLEAVEEDGTISQDVERLMLHTSGNHQRAVELIAQMLAKRDQWLRHVVMADEVLNKAEIEDVLQSVVDSARETACESIAAFQSNIDELLAFAKSTLPSDHLFHHSDNPDYHLLCVADMFLTAKNTPRKSVTKAQGFPAGKEGAAMKALWKDVSEGLSAHAITSLAAARSLPVAHYDESQWELLNSLFRVLLRAAAELKLIFNKEGKVDFVEVSSRAIAGLSPHSEDRRVGQRMFSLFKHIIVDEVQDINRTQYQMIESLVAEWDQSMSNTLCLVGDPKQSIYRFREADVGLFLQAQQYGVANVELERLNLSTNFRSSPNIVEFNNNVYQTIFPSKVDIAKGAMPYAPSVSARQGSALDGIETWCLSEPSDTGEAVLVAKAVKESKAISESAKIAVLVRSRSHLKAVAKQLKDDGVPYQAVEIENVAQKAAIQDLLSLTKAVLHPMDNIAWLSLLRSPVLGLCLQDLTLLLEDIGEDGVIERVLDVSRYPSLTQSGQDSIARMSQVIQWLFDNQYAFENLALIKAMWHQLNMAKGYNENDIDDIESYFSLLEEYRDDDIDVIEIERRLERFYAKPDPRPEASNVQLMTLHKSKGLEFDVVIIPGIGSRGHGEDPSLVMWHEFTEDTTGTPQMLIAPIKGRGEDDIYQFMMDIEKEKSALEVIRLLYVGTTRAKARLYLIGTVNKGTPTSSSLFAPLWPHLDPIYQDELLTKEDEQEGVGTEGESAGYIMADTRLVRVND